MMTGTTAPVCPGSRAWIRFWMPDHARSSVDKGEEAGADDVAGIRGNTV